MKKLSLAALAVSSLFALPACSSQVDSDYRGEPLATVQGNIVADKGAETDDLRAAVLNYNFLGSGFAVVDGARVVGSFPAEFRVDLLTPPRPEELNDFTEGGKRPSETRFSTGYLAVLHSGKDVNADPSAVAGIASDFILVYVESDVKPDTDSARFLGGVLKAGYHLMRYVPLTQDERAALLAQCDTARSASGTVFPNPGVCGGGDATDHLLENTDEFASKVAVQLVPDGQEIQGGNIF